MALWADLYKIWNYSFEQDPLERRAKKELRGAGVTMPDAMPQPGQDGSMTGGGRGTVRLRDSKDFIDLSTITNRSSRYKEYERLRNVPEIEMAMEIYADEACQIGENKHIFDMEIKNESVKEELEWLFFHRKMLNLDDPTVGWNLVKKLFIFGDHFSELIMNPENPKDGILGLMDLPCESMYRIETTQGKLIEFQQSNEQPDYQSLTRAPVAQATEAEIQQTTADQIVHWRVGDERKTFYPYGVSLIEAARGPAHQLRLMEDAMVVYRLTRAPERRVFYIDVGTLSPARAEAFVDRIKSQFRKRKISAASGATKSGASAVEERWHPPSQDEDYWLPTRPNSNTKIDTLPGAQNLGEIDDALYFRNKLFTALKFPKSYFSNEDVQVTRVSLSAQDVKFARIIERLQAHIAAGFMQLAERHLQLIGVPEEDYEDLKIKMTPPSDWRELTRQEIVTARINNANSIKGSMLLSDFDICTKILKYSEDETEEMQSRMKVQKLEDFKLQVLAQNPELLGVGTPGTDENEMGAEPGGPNPMLGPSAGGGAPPGGMGGAPGMGGPPMGGAPGMGGPPMPPPPTSQSQGGAIPKASSEEIKKYDLEIQNYDLEQDIEDIDYSEG